MFPFPAFFSTIERHGSSNQPQQGQKKSQEKGEGNVNMHTMQVPFGNPLFPCLMFLFNARDQVNSTKATKGRFSAQFAVYGRAKAVFNPTHDTQFKKVSTFVVEKQCPLS